MGRRHDQPPELKHAHRAGGSGFFYTRWGGRMHTFGSDEDEARRQFLGPDSVHPGSLRAWQQFIALRAGQAPLAPQSQRGPRTVIELAELFFSTYEQENRDRTAAYFRGALRRFLQSFGAMPTTVIDLAALEAFRLDLMQIEIPARRRYRAGDPIVHSKKAKRAENKLKRLDPKTISHELKAIKTFWRWACRFHSDRCRPIELSAIKTPRQSEPRSQAISLEAVRGMINKAAEAHPELRSWLSVAYLCLLRPSEVLRLAANQGHFEPLYLPTSAEPLPGAGTTSVAEDGLYVMESKVGHLTGSKRYVVVTDEAREWIRQMQRHSVIQAGPRRGQLGPRWVRLDNFSEAVRGVCGHGPSVLRDSAATHLMARGVARGVVDELLGHVPSAVSRSYIQTTWHTHRAAAGLLRL